MNLINKLSEFKELLQSLSDLESENLGPDLEPAEDVLVFLIEQCSWHLLEPKEPISPNKDLTSTLGLYSDFVNQETTDKDIGLKSFLESYEDLVNPEKILSIIGEDYFQSWLYLLSLGICAVRKVYFSADYLTSTSKGEQKYSGYN